MKQSFRQWFKEAITRQTAAVKTGDGGFNPPMLVSQNSFLILVVRLVHFLMIAFVVLCPFVGDLSILPAHIAFTGLMMGHWLTNNNTCAWTMLEMYLRGVKDEESFIFNFVYPFFSSGRMALSGGECLNEDCTEKDYFRKVAGSMIWIITVLVFSLSWIRLYSAGWGELSKWITASV